jgi:hypothetical protein
VAAAAPVIDLASVQVYVSGVDTSISGHGGWSVSAFFVGPRFAKHHYFLLGEISDVVHGDGLSGRGRLETLINNNYIAILSMSGALASRYHARGLSFHIQLDYK